MKRTFALALLAVVALAPRTGADVANLQAVLDDSLKDVQDAADALLGKERVTAIAFLDEALLEADSAVLNTEDPAVQAELGTLAAKVAKKVAAYRKAVLAARDAMANTNVPDLWAVKAAGRAAKAGYGAEAGFAKVLSHGPTPVEVKGSKAGFHQPGEFVDIRIYPGVDEFGDPCPAPVFVVVDPFGNGSVVPGTPVSVTNSDGSITVTVEMGASGGPARLEVSGCGVTRSSLLFNYGPIGTFAPKVSVDRFDGVYVGTYSGTAYAAGAGTQPVSGGVSLTVAGGTITVTDPGAGMGSLSARGAAGITGSGVVGGDSYRFNGKFTATSFGTGPGSATASGTWSATFDGGTSHGFWSATR
jgi:hypothetical protein